MQCLVYIIYITSDKLVTEQIMLRLCVHQWIGFSIQAQAIIFVIVLEIGYVSIVYGAFSTVFNLLQKLL
jgi:hypothetical protein